MSYPILVIDDCISKEDQDKIENQILSTNFPWYYTGSANWGEQKDFSQGLLSLGKIQRVVDTPQFIHYLYNQEVWSDHLPIDFTIKILSSIPYTIKELIRIKTNLTYQCKNFIKGSTGVPHIDFTDSALITAIYYVNESDGDTIIYDEFYEDKIYSKLNISQIIKPKKGRLIIFDGRRIHSGASPIDNSQRAVINFDFIPHNI